jgi:hypothetical protein
MTGSYLYKTELGSYTTKDGIQVMSDYPARPLDKDGYFRGDLYFIENNLKVLRLTYSFKIQSGKATYTQFKVIGVYPTTGSIYYIPKNFAL